MSLLTMDIVDYELFRANECANDLLDRVIEGTTFDTLLKIRNEADVIMAKFAALSETAQRRAVQVSHNEVQR